MVLKHNPNNAYGDMESKFSVFNRTWKWVVSSCFGHPYIQRKCTHYSLDGRLDELQSYSRHIVKKKFLMLQKGIEHQPIISHCTEWVIIVYNVYHYIYEKCLLSHIFGFVKLWSKKIYLGILVQKCTSGHIYSKSVILILHSIIYFNFLFAPQKYGWVTLY